MESIESFERLGLALAIGAVVGVERHWRERDEGAGKRTAGIRTFMIVGMLGGLSGLIEQTQSPQPALYGLVVVAMFAIFSAIFALYQFRESIVEGDYSVTTVVAAMTTFALGSLAVLGNARLAAAGGVSLVAILASREILHRFVRALSWNELRSAIVFLAMAVIVLPILPTAPLGPFGGISPSGTWQLVVLLAGTSFLGYVAVKAFGQVRGELVAGAVNGLVSSTAIAVTNARLSLTGQSAALLVAGATAANAVSYLKVLFYIAILAPPIAVRLGPSLVAAALVMAGFSLLFARKDTAGHTEHRTRNPFELLSVLKTALLLVAVGFFARAAAAWFGQSGLLVVSTLSGLADIDAITVTIAGILDTISAEFAAMALGAAVAANTVAKTAYALVLGGRAYSGRFVLASASALVAGIVVFETTPVIASLLPEHLP
ncbi:MgtC/SapB family protein [Rhizobium sp. BR 315]|uniref:MgtC/SapB family protein n=1 Tax=Rhizobium sp. BR 315 TaxID=3040014 RepID=UPI003D32AE7C